MTRTNISTITSPSHVHIPTYICTSFRLWQPMAHEWNISVAHAKLMAGLPKFSSKKKIWCHLQIFGATNLTESKFHTEDSHFWSDLQTSRLSGAVCSVHAIYTHICTKVKKISEAAVYTFCWSGDLAPRKLCTLALWHPDYFNLSHKLHYIRFQHTQKLPLPFTTILLWRS